MSVQIMIRNNKIIMENQQLRAEILPKRGGKIASLRFKGSEMLFQPKDIYCGIPSAGAPFADYEAAGFDDAFPNIDPETIDFNGKKIQYNDHGDIWTSEFESDIKDNRLILGMGNNRYTFGKSIELADNSISLLYSVKNVSDELFPCFYTMHCLFRYEDGMRIIFPEEVAMVENAIDCKELGKKGILYHYPAALEDIDLSYVGKSSGVCRKFYASDAVTEGRCALDYTKTGFNVMLEWDAERLPYLGFWITEGGFRGDYNCAPEPSSGYYDSISKAIDNRKLWMLEPGEEKKFKIRITIQERRHEDNGK